MAHECKDCTFIPDKENLLIFIIPRELKEKAGPKPLFVGKYTMPSWMGHSGFYLFTCQECGMVGVDYPHGYRGPGFVYLKCGSCRHELILKPRKFRKIYERDELYVPRKASRKERRELAQALKKRSEELEQIRAMGVVPIVLPRPRPGRTFLRRLLSLVGL